LITSRNPQSLLPLIKVIDSRSPVTALSSDIRSLHIPREFRDGNLIHAATPASASFNANDPAGMLEVIISGQRQILSEASRLNCKVLFLSSGAVYGRQPLDLLNIPESWAGAPLMSDVSSAYHEGKRVAELMGNIAAEREGLHFVSARLFAFIAPFLPLGTHFAAGNFLRDAMTTGQIVVSSGGGSQRTYLYATDLCAHLWALLQNAQTGQAYNLGSEAEVTIRDLAKAVVEAVNPSATILIKGNDDVSNVSRYVPSVDKMRQELGKVQLVDLSQAIKRTSSWLSETLD
jgi:dTDP-glucose 4,6-dehydratase